MKTTIEISDPLLDAARELAANEGVTLRTVVERGLRRVVAEPGRARRFKLRAVSFAGNGLQAPLEGVPWEILRALVYEGRGG